MSRVPVAVWWFLLLVAAGVAIVPVGSAEHDAEQAQLSLAEARSWQGTTEVVEGRFTGLGRVQEVLPGSYSATATYEVEPAGESTQAVDLPARSDGGPPEERDQPATLSIRLGRDGADRLEAVEWGTSLSPPDVVVAERADAASATSDEASRVRWVVAAGLGVLALGCVLLTVVAAREPGGLWRRFAGTRARVDAGVDVRERAARSAELPAGMLVLTVLALLSPLGWPDRGTAVLTGLVALAALALLVREREAVAAAPDTGSPDAASTGTARRRLALVWRSSAALGVLLGLLLLFLGWFSSGLAPDAAEGGEMLRRGVGVLALSAATLGCAFLHRRGSGQAL